MILCVTPHIMDPLASDDAARVLPAPASPTSLPGRDPTADADTSLIRKRPRLTPPQHGIDDCESPRQSTESPLVIEVVSPDHQADFSADVIILDDEPSDFTSIDSFPWVERQRGPEHTAAIFADLCCDIESKRLSVQEIATFANWIRDYVAVTPETPDSRPYLQNRKFWFHVGRCFEGLASRRLGGAFWKAEASQTLWHSLLGAFGKLYAILCAVEVDQLERMASRRDSLKSTSPTKSTLLFFPYMLAFERFLSRNDFSWNSAEHNSLVDVQEAMALSFIRQQKESNAFFRLYHLVATKTEFVEFPYDVTLSQLRLSVSILYIISVNSKDPEGISEDVQSFRRTMANLLDVTTTNVMPEILKAHPDHLPTNFHCISTDILADIVGILNPSEFPPSLHEVIQDACRRSDSVTVVDTFSSETSRPADLQRQNPPASLVYKLEVSKSFMRSGIMALRVTGIDLLGHYLSQLWKEYVRNGDFPGSHPILQFAASYLHATDFVGYLFGVESHADLIRRSGRAIEFLLATRNLTRPNIDMLWNTCLKNQQADFGQASFQVLSALARPAGLPETMFLCKKYEHMSPSQIGRPMIALFKEITISLTKKDPEPEACYDIAHLSIVLLQKVSSEWKDVEVQPMRDIVSNCVAGLLVTSGRVEEYRRKLLEFCAEHIRNHSIYATGSTHAFLDLLKCPPTDVSKASVPEILPFKEIVSEVSHYVHNRKEGCDGVFALHSRVRLAHLVIACTPGTYDIETEKILWDLTTGIDAIDAQARNLAWQTLVLDVKSSPTLYGYFERCITQYLPALASECATTGIIAAYQYSLESALTSPELCSSFNDEIVRFALTAPDDDVAETFILVVMDVVFQNQTRSRFPATADQQIAIVERCIDCIRTRSSSPRAISLLRKILHKSLESHESAKTVDKDVADEIESPQAQGMIRIPVQIFGDANQAMTRVVVMRGHETLSDLHVALARISKFDDFLVICGGQFLDIHDSAHKKLSETSIPGKSLLLKKKCTLQSIQQERSKRHGRTTHEQAILRHIQDLYACLDDGDETSEQIFWLLTELQPSTTCDALSLNGSTWRVTYSMHCLLVELHEQISQGVADATFMTRGVHALLQALEQYGNSTCWLLLQFLTTALFEFLHERPVQDLSESYFTRPSCFVQSGLSTLRHLTHNANMLQRTVKCVAGDLAQTAFNLYRSILEAARLSPGVCKALLETTDFESLHQDIWFSGNRVLSSRIADCIRRFCIDKDAPSEVKSLFWTTFSNSIPKAQINPGLCAAFYRMAPEILTANDKIDEEDELRALINTFSSVILNTDHEESFGQTLPDSRISGLCALLLCCVDRLKSFKKPLKLDYIATKIFQRYLFPVEDGGNDHKALAVPIISSETRRDLYTLVQATCEDIETLTEVTKLVMQALRQCDISPTFNYPGREGFTRARCGYSGLYNLQQTCYMNSLLQQLFMNLHFRKFILGTPVVDESRQVVLLELRRAFASLQDNFNLAYFPENLAKALDVDVTVQDDAQIFFTILIGKLEDSMLDETAKTKLKSFFRGVNKSQTAGACGHVSESPDEYYNLSLVVKDKSSLEESLQEYVQGAFLEGGDKFKCVTCDSKEGGTYVNAVRRTGLEQIPDNLVLGLKRFRYETYDGGAKVNDVFDFPERIDMNAYKLQYLTDVEKPSDPDMYQLVGVVVHDGTLQYGHYWSYAAERYHSPGSAMPWLKLEDRLATEVTLDEVFAETRGGYSRIERDGQAWLRSDNAYVLFYERLSSIESAKSLTTGGNASIVPNSGLCPKVPMPEDLASDIAAENENHIRMLNIYATEHADFVRGLLLRFEQMSKGQPTEDNHVEKSLLELAFEHLYHVTIRTQTLDHLDHIMSSLRRLIFLHPENAMFFCDLLFRQPDVWICERFLFHRRPVVRSNTQRLVVACLRSLREQDPDRYGADSEGRITTDQFSYVRLVLDAHADLLHRLPAARTAWPEYFDFVVDIAAFGPNETALLFDLGYLSWCLEVLLIRYERELQTKHSEIWYHMQRNRVYPFHALPRAIFGLLKDHVDLIRLPTVSSPDCQHLLIDESIALYPDEVFLISLRNTRGRSALANMTAQSMHDTDDHSKNASLQLVALLSNQTRVSKGLLEPVYLTLQGGLRDETTCVYMDIVAYCIAHGNMPLKYQHSLIEAVAQLPEEFEDMSESVLKFMTRVYHKEPLKVLDLVTRWADKMLACEDSESEEAVVEWLKVHLFRHSLDAEAPSGEGLRLEYQRMMTIKTLAGILMETLKKARDKRLDYDDYERAVDALQLCVTWLKESGKMMKDRLERGHDTHEESDDMVDDDAQLLALRPTLATVSMEDLDEAAVDAGDVVEQCQDMFDALMEWSLRRDNPLAFRDKDRGARRASVRYSDTDDADTDMDFVDSDGEDGAISESGWIDEGGDAELQ